MNSFFKRFLTVALCVMLVLSVSFAESAEETANETETAPVTCECCGEEIELTEEGKNPHVLPCSIFAPVDENGEKIGKDSIHYSCDGKEHTDEINKFCPDGHCLCQADYEHTCVILVEINGEEEDWGCGDVYPCHESDEHALCKTCGEPWCLNGNARHRSRCGNPSHRPCAEGYRASAHAVCECGAAYECTEGHENGVCKPVVIVEEEREEEKEEKPTTCPDMDDCCEEMMDCGIHCRNHATEYSCYICGGCEKPACQGNHEDCELPC